jgi:uncharacterized protein (DUF433 family)
MHSSPDLHWKSQYPAVVAGTRITVEFILEDLAHGQPIDVLVDSHPTLTREGVPAALDYAAKVLRLDVVDSIEAS